MTTTAKPRLPRKKGRTMNIETGCGIIKITIDEEHGKVVSVLIRPEKKKGGCMTSNVEGHGRVISLAIRSGVTIENIIDTYKNIGCSSPVVNGATSCCDAISRALESYLRSKKNG
jgi:ribonucleoside-diphosphate reductase alpha chain